METVPLYNLEKNIENIDLLLAHISDNEKDETLAEHSQKTINFFYRLSREKEIGKIINKIINSLKIKGARKFNSNVVLFIKGMFLNAIYLHDIGKINPAFQKLKMNNKNIDHLNSSISNDTKHSLLSSIIYIDIFNKKINYMKDADAKRFLEYLLYVNAYIISRHHSYLKNIDNFINDLEDLQDRIEEYPGYIKFYKSSNIKNIDLANSKFKNRKNLQKKLDYNTYANIFILSKLLFSLIVSCDFYATYNYMNDNISDFGLIKNIKLIINRYKQSKLYKGIEKYKSYKNGQTKNNPFGNNSINSLRSELFLEAEENLIKNIDKSIFYLEAPTGSGKTNTSINLALNIVQNRPEYNKIFYIFPFNTLVEQTNKKLYEAFSYKGKDYLHEFKIAVINSITPIITEEENKEKENETDYNRYLLDRQFLHYPLILTTHINFFNYLFGTGREINLPLVHLCNSVIIIDEIQSYKNNIWKEIVMFLDKYSKLLNIKVIIMSATLPKLDNLLNENKENKFVKLIEDKEKYYKSKFFKDRVKIDFSLLDKKKYTSREMVMEELIKKIESIWKSGKSFKILIEFITKKSARKFYNKIKERNVNRKIFELSGDDNKITRGKILNRLNGKNINRQLKDVLIVSTQVIEAGVDIDMDIGFKDISLLDNEEQFLGRINRSCTKEKCMAYFFNLDEANKIYRGDKRLERNLEEKEYREYLINKNFDNFYHLCFKRIEEKNKELGVNNLENFLNEIRSLNYSVIEKRMKLINEKYLQIYLSHQLKDEKGNVIDGNKIWENLKLLIYDNEMEYAEKQVKLSQIYSKMSYFIYNIHTYGKIKYPLNYDEAIGNIFYIKNGNKFITVDGKFDREKYLEESGALFL